MTSPFGVAAAIAVAIALSPTLADAGSVTLQYLVTVDHEQRADSFGGCCVHSAITPIQFTLDVTLYDQVLGPSGAYAMDFAAPTFSVIPLGDGLPAFTSGLARVGNQPAPYVDYAQASASARVATSSADGSTTINSRSVTLSHQTSGPGTLGGNSFDDYLTLMRQPMLTFSFGDVTVHEGPIYSFHPSVGWYQSGVRSQYAPSTVFYSGTAAYIEPNVTAVPESSGVGIVLMGIAALVCGTWMQRPLH